jgi:hypothetical protein
MGIGEFMLNEALKKPETFHDLFVLMAKLNWSVGATIVYGDTVETLIYHQEKDYGKFAARYIEHSNDREFFDAVWLVISS